MNPQDRRRKYELSSHGKRTRRNSYRERWAWLDRVKAEKACRVCGETNPRVLDFYPRNPQTIKFAPRLKNASRSLQEWEKVLKASDVLCLSCAVKGRRLTRGRPAGTLRNPKNPPLTARNQIVNAFPRPGTPSTCKTCGAELGAKKGVEKGRGRQREFCGPSCRLLFWTGRKLAAAYREGRAPGLLNIVAELGRVRRRA